MQSRKDFVRAGVIGVGDNLIRKILNSVEKVEGIKITAIADKYSGIDSALEVLENRKDSKGEPMYSDGLKKTINNLREKVNKREIRYFSTESNEFENSFFENIDAVHISSTNETHSYYAVLCAKKLKHLLVEKPFVETYIDAVQTIREINRARGDKELALICASHYLRYGPSQELIKNFNRLDYPIISSIVANFLEDESYLNDRTKAQFSRNGAIHDMVVHYVALLHKIGAKINPTKAIIYALPDYNGETAAISISELTGTNFGSECHAEIKAAKGSHVNSKNFTINFEDGRIVQLDFSPDKRGIYDNRVTDGEKWWDENNIHIDPFERIYAELRDEVKRIEYGFDKGMRAAHTLEDSLKDQEVLDRTKKISCRKNHEEYYGTQVKKLEKRVA